MRKRTFLIPSLVAAGFSADRTDAVLPQDEARPPDHALSLFQVFRMEHRYTLAAHRSHSSHGSHRSGSGGYAVPSYPSTPSYTPPAAPENAPSTTRNLNSTPPSSVLPGSPSTAPLKTLPGNTAKFADIVRQLQTALYAYGYYSGAVDGRFGSETKSALVRFQQEWKLPVTGTITPETLDALHIAAK